MRDVVRRAAIVAVLVGCGGCIVVSGPINPFSQRQQPLRETVVSGEGRDKVLLLDISRVITGEERERTFGLSTEESTVARVQEELRKARDDSRVRAVVLRINSPGGGVTASDTIYREVRRFAAETKRPVVAALLDVAASGGYYVALAADHVVASPTTVTGSIGVVMIGLNFEGLMAKLGVRNQTMKAGANKDLLSPLRAATPEERAIVQSILDELHERFIALVQENRPRLKRAEIERITDGRIFTAAQALELGLVDQIGYLDDAIATARRAAGVERARVIIYHRPDEYRENIYSRAVPAGRGGDAWSVALRLPDDRGPRFMYLWAPSVGALASP
jgi:protease-4